jgi:glycosyltransferase involved in cell wall biosynthesis
MRIAVVMPRGSVMGRDKANSMETVARTLLENSRLKGSVRVICDAGADVPALPDLLTVPAGLSKSKRADAVAELLAGFDPDYIEYHQQLESSAALARRFPNKINVLYRHTRIKQPKGALDRLRYGARLKAFDKLIFVSKAAGQEFIGDYPALAGRVASVCNPIEMDAWKACPDSREKLILFSGRAMEEKGLEPFCDALAAVLDKNADWRGALMLGDWDKHADWATPRIEALARFGDRVEIHKSASLPQVQAVTRRAAIAVTPSFVAEALGLSALEAHAAGAALISSGRGGLREASGDHAVYVDPPQAPDLTRAMAALVANDDARIAMARAGQDFVASVHAPAVRSAQLDDLRERLLVEQARSRRPVWAPSSFGRRVSGALRGRPWTVQPAN